MRIDRPTCLYGEPNCRKHFDGNCMVENDFDTRCPICKTLNEVLKVTDAYIELHEKIEQTATNRLCRYTAGATANDFRIFKTQVEELKGGK